MPTGIRPAHVAVFALVALACSRSDPLREPRPPEVFAPAPDSFTVSFETTKGAFLVLGRRHWSPAGVDRFHYLVRNEFYDNVRFFRTVPNFVVQFGIPGDPEVAALWQDRRIPDDAVRTTNRRGTVSFARGGRESRSTQIFINLRDNPRLDTLSGFGFPPIAEVVQGMHVVDSLHSGYGEGPPRGRGPNQDSIRLQGNAYLDRAFPRVDGVLTARIVTEW